MKCNSASLPSRSKAKMQARYIARKTGKKTKAYKCQNCQYYHVAIVSAPCQEPAL